MTDLLHILPDFPTKSYTHLIPSLEKNLVTTTDLLTLDAVEIARRAQLPPLDVRRLTQHVIALLQGQLGLQVDTRPQPQPSDVKNKPATPSTPSLRTKGTDLMRGWSMISTLDEQIDIALGGGIPTGYLTEVTGESGVGKTQLLLTLLLAAQLPTPHGLARSTLYISTEHPLPTTRLRQLLKQHPILATHPTPPTLSRIFTLTASDLEVQDHVLSYQLPVVLSTHDIGLVVIDSIAANYRAEATTAADVIGVGRRSHGGPGAQLAARSASLARTGALLRDLARKHDVAVVTANQVSDRIPRSDPQDGIVGQGSSQPGSLQRGFASPPSSSSSSSCPAGALLPLPTHTSGAAHDVPTSSTSLPRIPSRSADPARVSSPRSLPTAPPLTLDHQLRFFTGQGDEHYPASSPPLTSPFLPSSAAPYLKTPALGLVWANQIACRIVLRKESTWASQIPSGAREGDRVAVQDSGADGGLVDESEPPLRRAEWAPRSWRRWAKVVFAAWTAPVKEGERGVEFEVWAGGVRGVGTKGDGKLM